MRPAFKTIGSNQISSSPYVEALEQLGKPVGGRSQL